MSARTCGFDSRPRHHFEIQVSLDDGGNLKGVVRALVAQWIERSPAKAEVVGSNPAKRAIFFAPLVTRSCWGLTRPDGRDSIVRTGAPCII